MTDLRCDVRNVDSEPNIVISFNYRYEESNERLFRFERNKNETLKQTFARISLNINNCLNKKLKKCKKQQNLQNKEILIQLKDSDTIISDLMLNKDVWKEGQILEVGEHSYRVIVNSAAVKTIRLPKVIMSSFIVYPTVVLEFCTSNECRYQWFRSKTNSKDSEKDWIPTGEEFYYNTSSDDIGSHLKVICQPMNGLQKEAISEEPVGANPGLCPFEERHLFCEDNTSFGAFRIVSYNILADIYADSDYSRNVLYPYCPSYALAIDYRKQLLIKELIGYNADIYCLQEVDKQVFDNDLNPVMNSNNKYKGVFGEKGTTGEGLAMFYNTSKFELINEKVFSYAKELKYNPLFAQLFEKVSVNEKLVERLMARKTVFQSILLRSVENPNRAILLGNTHLYYHPDSDHIRLLQSYIFVKHLENYRKKLKKIAPELTNVSPILCGDFNSCPEFGVLQLMTTGFVQKDIEDFKSNSDETFEGFNMRHELSLESACGQPVYTNYTPFFSGCLDYIFYDSNELTVSEVIPLPSHEQVVQNIAIPSIVFPSDHLALVAVLRWKDS